MDRGGAIGVAAGCSEEQHREAEIPNVHINKPRAGGARSVYYSDESGTGGSTRTGLPHGSLWYQELPMPSGVARQRSLGRPMQSRGT